MIKECPKCFLKRNTETSPKCPVCCGPTAKQMQRRSKKKSYQKKQAKRREFREINDFRKEQISELKLPLKEKKSPIRASTGNPYFGFGRNRRSGGGSGLAR